MAGPGEAEARESVAPPPAVAMKPLMISKVNTCLQIGLGMGALAQGAAEAGQVR